MNKIYEFIRNLRESEERIKRRWLFIFSGVSMVIVVFLWVAYFNSFVQPAGGAQAQQTEQTAGQGFGFWDAFKAGLGTVMESSKKSFDYVLNKIRQPKSYDITPQ